MQGRLSAMAPKPMGGMQNWESMTKASMLQYKACMPLVKISGQSAAAGCGLPRKGDDCQHMLGSIISATASQLLLRRCTLCCW